MIGFPWLVRASTDSATPTLRTLLAAIVVIALFAFAPLSAQMPAVTSPSCGDCDADGFVTIIDALLAAQISAGSAIAPLTGSPRFDACNAHGAQSPAVEAHISALDALTIARHQVGLIGELNCAPPPSACAPILPDPRLLDAVIDYSPGPQVSAAFTDPARAINGVLGGGCTAGTVDVTSLGHSPSGLGGSITLRLGGRFIDNGPGDDLVIYENAFRPGGCAADIGFHETGVVEVSEDGVAWIMFPVVFDATFPGSDRRRFASGFCGVTPVSLRTDLGQTPGDLAGGGDRFDLDEIGLCRIRFVRIRDTGVVYPDDRTLPGDCDIDGVAAIYSSPDP